MVAQRQIPSFATYSEISLSARPIVLLFGDYYADSSRELIIVSRSPSSLNVYRTSPSGEFTLVQNILLPDSCDAAAAGDVNHDGYTDIAVLSQQSKVIYFYAGTSQGKFQASGKFFLDEQFDNVIIADITQDNRPDIILYGRKNLGVTVLPGNGDGTFRLPRVMFPDVPVGKIIVQSLNEDGIPDVVIHNWVTNTITFYYGNGFGGYSEESTFRMSDEISDVAVADLNGDKITDIILSSNESKSIHTFFGTGTGDFYKAQVIPLPFSPEEFKIVDINLDKKKDLVVFDKHSSTLGMILGMGRGFFGDCTIYSAGIQPASFIVGSTIVGKYPDLFVADRRQEKLLIYSNDHNVSINQLEYATGKSPSGLIVGDFNNDHISDIALVDEGSKTLSILFGEKNRKFHGQQTYMLPIAASSLIFGGSSEQHSEFICTSDTVESITIVDVDRKEAKAQMYQIPNAGIPKIACAFRNQSDKLDFISINESNRIPKSVSYFTQIGPTRFVEKNYQPASPNILLGAVPMRVNNDNCFDLTYVARDIHRARPYLASSFSDSLLEIHGQTMSSYLPDTNVLSATILHGDFNHDNVEDILLYVKKRDGAKMYIALGNGDSTFQITRQTFAILPSEHHGKIKVRDVDGGGNLDILVYQEPTHSIYRYKGNGDGTFLAPELLLKNDDIEDFDILHGSGFEKPVLVVTCPKRNTIRIVSIE